MKKEWLLTLASAVITVVVAIALVRWLAPGLLGYAPDQRLVRSSEEVPPFFENIFREADYNSAEFTLNDPYLVIRSKPLFPDVLSMGPNDILGFRNRAVPNKAAIVTIGDSQTYGNNARLEENWPGYMAKALFGDGPEQVYNMSVGGWGGVNYLRIMESAVRFNPQVIIIAYYTGNDAYTDFRNTYSIDELGYLRTDPSLNAGDLPEVVELREDQLYPVAFADGVETVFTPQYRYAPNNRNDPAILAGYDIMAATAREITRIALANDIQPIFTVIPTKEYVYREKVAAEAGLTANAAYRQLVADESANIAALTEQLAALNGAMFIDVAGALTEAARTAVPLYPPDVNGHPLPAGYRVIGETLANAMAEAGLLTLHRGTYGLVNGNQILSFILVTDEGMWTIEDPAMATGNGWEIEKIRPLELAEISGLTYLGILDEIDPERFGPDAVLTGN